MAWYPWTLVGKFVAVMFYAGGTVAAFVATECAQRKIAVHRVASPALLAVWLTGYALVLQTGVPVFELWVVGGLILSFVSNGALVHAVHKDRRSLGAITGCALPLLVVVMLMVFRPTWAGMGR